MILIIEKDNKGLTLILYSVMIILTNTINMLTTMQPFMFTKENMDRGYLYNNEVVPLMKIPCEEVVPLAIKEDKVIPSPAVCPLNGAGGFTPHNKDKLFWCFYIMVYGYEEYEINRTNAFSVEKRLKIEAVEQLKTIKEKLKELKLKRTELENELVHQPTISIKGLYALCLLHDVSITYVYGRKYYEINATKDVVSKKGIIIDDSLRWRDNNGDLLFYKKIQEEYWCIENFQKPLKAASAYTLKELQDISIKLQIDINTDGEKPKNKTKPKLYQEILQYI